MHLRARDKNQLALYDVVMNRAEDGCRLRLLAVIDESTEECAAVDVGRSFTSQNVMGVFQYLFAARGTPEHIRSHRLVVTTAQSSYPR
ncbi:MAG: hypothetical protein CMM07_11235 [Rhodopirellula sp.]|nr:hypothetical protein [Rhodopirellula sp.]